MKNLASLVLTVALVISYTMSYSQSSATSNIFTTDSKVPEITLYTQMNGVNQYFLDPILVEWEAIDDSIANEAITISISTDGGDSYEMVAEDMADIGTLMVNPPTAISDSAIVKIAMKDAFGNEVSDESSGLFSIHGNYLDLKVWLEGPYSGTNMENPLNQNGLIPLEHPFQVSPFNYFGSEKIIGTVHPDAVDWVLVELRDASDANSATSATMIERQAALLMKDGNIKSMDGVSNLETVSAVTQNLFVVLWHRNHLGIISASPLVSSGYDYTYDFSTGEDKVLGGANGYKQIDSTEWGMAGGDGNQDGWIDETDKTYFWLHYAGKPGYLDGDFNLDGQIGNPDKNDVWTENRSNSSQIPDGE